MSASKRSNTQKKTYLRHKHKTSSSEQDTNKQFSNNIKNHCVNENKMSIKKNNDTDPDAVSSKLSVDEKINFNKSIDSIDNMNYKEVDLDDTEYPNNDNEFNDDDDDEDNDEDRYDDEDNEDNEDNEDDNNDDDIDNNEDDNNDDNNDEDIEDDDDDDDDDDNYDEDNEDNDNDDNDEEIKKKTNKNKTMDLTESDIIDLESFSEFHQPIQRNESEDYIGICDNLLSNLKLINEPNYNMINEKKTTNKLTVMHQMINDINKIKSKLQQIIDIGKCFNSRDLMISSFAKTSNNIIKVFPVTCDEFDRKCLECPRALEKLFADNLYGNPIGSSIKFIFGKIDDVTFMTYMDKLRLTTERPIEQRLTFGTFRLDKLYKDDVIVRNKFSDSYIQFVMIMTNIEAPYVSIKCYAVNKNHYSTNTRIASIDYYGIHIYDAIPDLVLRRVVLCHDLTKFIFQLTGTMKRTTRAAIWELILNVVTNDIEYLNQGYKYITIGNNKMIKFSTETINACEITTLSPPYIKIHLACNHSLSIMAIYGLVYDGEVEGSESILCPMCRRNLIPKLIQALPENEINNYTVKDYVITDVKTNIVNEEFVFENKHSTMNVIQQHFDEPDNFINAIFDKSKNMDPDIEEEYDIEDLETLEEENEAMNRENIINYLASIYNLDD